jgi:dTDP-4-amino-4,6-dideoxygalactose transaminase
MRAAGLDKHVRAPSESANCFHIYNQFVVTTKSRDALQAHLSSRGVGTEVYYPVPLHLQECFSSLGYRKQQFPHAEAAAGESLALPIYSELEDEQLRYVVDAMVDFFDTARRPARDE